jgi:NAD(P)-dependent dehydrogenase (short-subunit alcohol dehydrogenase family)
MLSRCGRPSKPSRAPAASRTPFPDVSQFEDVEKLRDQVERSYGPVSILVNAAGIFGPIQLVKESDPRRWLKPSRLIYLARISPAGLPRAACCKSGGGRIINFTSAAALHPPGPQQRVCHEQSSSKPVHRHLAAELESSGVTANVIHPGDVKTGSWAAIRDEAERMGPEADAYRKWVRWVEQTGGDDPKKAADLNAPLAGRRSGGCQWPVSLDRRDCNRRFPVGTKPTACNLGGKTKSEIRSFV